jgi:hypothetical protein
LYNLIILWIDWSLTTLTSSRVFGLDLYLHYSILSSCLPARWFTFTYPNQSLSVLWFSLKSTFISKVCLFSVLDGGFIFYLSMNIYFSMLMNISASELDKDFRQRKRDTNLGNIIRNYFDWIVTPIFTSMRVQILC